MIHSVKQAIILACILIGLAGLGWHQAGENTPYRLDPDTLSNLPDQAITALEIRQFDHQGQLIHHVRTPSMHHIPIHNQHWAEMPQLTSTLPNQPSWTIHALEAKAYLKQNIQHGRYHGQVQLDHGNTHVRAYSATTQSDANHQLTLATALGHGAQQAHVWTHTALNKPPLHAFADRIRYEPPLKRIILSGRARLTQGDQYFSAPEIIYDLKKQQIITQAHAAQRTRIIIHSPLKQVLRHE